MKTGYIEAYLGQQGVPRNVLCILQTILRYVPRPYAMYARCGRIRPPWIMDRGPPRCFVVDATTFASPELGTFPSPAA